MTAKDGSEGGEGVSAPALPEIRSAEAADAEGAFLVASIAVWREIDRLDAQPDGYHPIRMSVELRQRERAAWNRYRDALNADEPATEATG